MKLHTHTKHVKNEMEKPKQEIKNLLTGKNSHKLVL